MKVVLVSSLVILLGLTCNGIRLQHDLTKKDVGLYSDEINMFSIGEPLDSGNPQKMILDYLKMKEDNKIFERDVSDGGSDIDENGSACDSDPCQHNGLCTVDEPSNGYSCNCTDTGYTGNTCEFVLLSCLVNPCLNGGTCTDSLCQCPDGFYGTLCEKSNDRYTPESSLPPAGQTCSVWDRTNFRTFDGMVYSVNSECLHTLMTESTGSTFKISVDFRNDAMAVGVIYNNGQTSISLTLTSDGVVYNSQLITANENIGPVLTSFVSHYIILETDLDFFQIIWNRNNLVEIKILDVNLAGQISGMCGNYDGVPSNDAEFGNVQPATFDPVTLAENWKEYTGECEITDTCVDYKQLSQDDLDMCLHMNDLFSDCLNIVPIDSYMKACYKSICSCQNRNTSCVCPDYAAYASECSKEGVTVNWRSESLCPFECTIAGEVYNECGSTCGATCEYQDPDCQAETICLEGCHCSSEHVLLNGNCVNPVECPCFYGNDNYTHSQQVQTECDLWYV
ncbi:BMP-binding endothelial regulator protein-like [Anneissia japonica]|uniref:BMP-binding endothelial regulator protein-like n=1 Tax=Anneissia japonica TaxID=1529436 RepID=UPI001425AEFA|nr:BMP-binding endothelial regulator protein-like [Anneissia japonica]